MSASATEHLKDKKIEGSTCEELQTNMHLLVLPLTSSEMTKFLVKIKLYLQ